MICYNHMDNTLFTLIGQVKSSYIGLKDMLSMFFQNTHAIFSINTNFYLSHSSFNIHNHAYSFNLITHNLLKGGIKKHGNPSRNQK